MTWEIALAELTGLLIIVVMYEMYDLLLRQVKLKKGGE